MKKIISIFLVFISIFSLIPCNAVSAVTVLPNTKTGPIPPKSVYFSKEEVDRYFRYPCGTNVYYFYDEVAPVDNAIKNAFVEMNLNDKDYFHKLLTIYQWVGTNIHYGTPHTTKYSDLYEGLILHNGNCSTFAIIFNMFCIKAGIDKNNLGFVTGINGLGAHVVNLVKFEESWYSVDTSDNAATSVFPFMEALSNLGMTDLDFSVPKNFSKNKLAKYSLPFNNYQSNSKPISTEDFNFSMRQICGTKRVSLSWNMPQYIKCVQVFEYHDESFLTVGTFSNFDTGKPYCTNLSSTLPFFNRNDNITTLEFDISEDTEFQIVGYGEYYQVYKSPILSASANVSTQTHNFGELTTVNPTCTEAGYTSKTCEICGYEKKVISKPYGHDLGEVIECKKPTCESAGYNIQYCSRCQKNIKTNVDKLNHSYPSTYNITPATTKADGLKSRTCTRCQKKENFTINKIASITLSYNSKVYNGTPIKAPTVTVTDSKNNVLKRGTDFDIKTSTNITTPSTYNITVKFKGNYSGKETKNFTVKGKIACVIYPSKKTIKKKQTIKVEPIVYDINGKILTKGVDYTITPNTPIKVAGTYTYKIIGKGLYTSSKTITIKVYPHGTNINSSKGVKSGFIVKWKTSSSNISKYQVQFSTDKNFKSNCKTITVEKDKLSLKVKKLKRHKDYYVRIRTFKYHKEKDHWVKYYSSWSSVKKIRTK